jgi:hypothetical protein
MYREESIAPNGAYGQSSNRKVWCCGRGSAVDGVMFSETVLLLSLSLLIMEPSLGSSE